MKRGTAVLGFGVMAFCLLAHTARGERAPEGLPDLRRPFENSLDMRFAPVEGLDGVLFGVWETRVRDFRAFVADEANNEGYGYHSGEQPYVLQSDGWKQRGWEYGWYNTGFPQTDDHPVACVSWEDAQAFCAWLTRVERATGRIGPSQVYRLPQDWEWSVAVGLDEPRAGPPKYKHERAPGYPWGSNRIPPDRWGNIAGEEAQTTDWPSIFSVLSGYRDDHAHTSPVGYYGPRHGALCDLGGNVREWCEDPAGGRSGFRVLRGGSWYLYDTRGLSSSYRRFAHPGIRRSGFGFRVVLAEEKPH